MIWLIAVLFALSGCTTAQTEQTRIYRQPIVKGTPSLGNERGPVDWAEVRLIDSRPPFKAQLEPVPLSLNLHWYEFVNPDRTPFGVILQPYRNHTRRMASYGLEPGSDVVIVSAVSEEGILEAAHLAYILSYLGFERVRIRTIDEYPGKLEKIESEPFENVTTWERQPRQDFVTTPADFLNSAMRVDPEKPVRILDVRSESEFLGRRGRSRVNMSAMNIAWTEFYLDNGELNVSMAESLLGLGWKRDEKIFVISDRGQRAAAAVFALTQLGFQAATVLGGYDEVEASSDR